MISKEQSKADIQILIDKYQRLKENGKIKKFNEERTKNEFIEPLFEALGWDIRNRQVDDEVTKEVKVSKGRADYAFRINGIPKFFVEAKAMKIDLNNPILAEQAINYAYLKSTTWAILTDFEGIKIFNSEWKARSLSEARFIEIKWDQYIERFDELWYLSKESMIKGELDRFAERVGKKTKKTPIDKQLLSEMMKWRELLSKDIIKLNESKNLTQIELDEAVQRILDRLIFIRKCEDVDIESAQLRSRLRIQEDKQRSKLVRELNEIFSYFRENYNSGLFGKDSKDIHLSEQLEISNDVLRIIINGLYTTPDRSISYDFSVIDADVLGNIYEQYLGFILKKTDKRAKIDPNMVHRKEQGIYYTPTFIVDYIVENTVGEYIKNKKPEQVEKIKILDPACGSGSFLIKAYDELDNYFKKKTGLDSFLRKSKILTDNIHGVDLDEKAVEIARLNLLMKTAEKKQKLPILRENIRCGNSLIDDPEYAGDKAFDWDEKYKDIIQEGGFDIIIGNPPWLMAGYYIKNEEEIDFLRDRYQSATGKFDLYYCFIELGIRLLKDNGIFGMIVPNKFFHTKSAGMLRDYLISTGFSIKIMDFGYEKIFEGATNYSCILIIQKKSKPKLDYSRSSIDFKIKSSIKKPLKDLQNKPWSFESEIESNIFNKMKKKGVDLKEIVLRFGTGCQTGADKIFFINDPELPNYSKGGNILRRILRGRNVRRYNISSVNGKTIFPYRIENNEFRIMEENELRKFKKIYKKLDENKEVLIKRRWFGKNAIELSGKWYGYMYIDKLRFFSKDHILTPSLSNRSNFTRGTGDLFVTGTAGVTSIILKDIPESIQYIIGLLNSDLMSFFICKHSPVFQGGYYKFSSPYLKNIPIKRIDFQNDTEANIHNKIKENVDILFDLHKRLSHIGNKMTEERKRIENDIKKAENNINFLVYKIYGITQEERKIVEEAI